MAPIVRNGADGERDLVMARWGMPGPPQFGGGAMPATSFCEYADNDAAVLLAEPPAPMRAADITNIGD